MKNLIKGIIISMALYSGMTQALVIGVEDDSSIVVDWLNSQGHTAMLIDSSNAASFTGLDTFLSVRGSISATTTANVTDFVNSGGNFVSEWQSTDIIMSMFSGTSIGNNYIGTGTTVDIFEGASSILDGVNDFASSAQTEFNWDTDISGTSLTLLGTIAGQNAIFSGSYGLGSVVGLSFDWQDNPWSSITGSGSLDLNRLLLNSLQYSAAVPEPATLALLGMGIAGLGFSRRKIRS